MIIPHPPFDPQAVVTKRARPAASSGWHHVTISRSNGIEDVRVDGVRVELPTSSTLLPWPDWLVGFLDRHAPGPPWPGYPFTSTRGPRS